MLAQQVSESLFNSNEEDNENFHFYPNEFDDPFSEYSTNTTNNPVFIQNKRKRSFESDINIYESIERKINSENNNIFEEDEIEKNKENEQNIFNSKRDEEMKKKMSRIK